MAAAPILDSEALATVRQQGLPALAWEVLRRDPAYSAAYQTWCERSERQDLVDPAFVARWGLHFP